MTWKSWVNYSSAVDKVSEVKEQIVDAKELIESQVCLWWNVAYLQKPNTKPSILEHSRNEQWDGSDFI